MTQSKHPQSSSINIFPTHVSAYHSDQKNYKQEQKTNHCNAMILLCSALFFKLYHLQKRVGLGFFQQILGFFFYVGMMFASFPVVSFNHQVTPRCFPTHVLKKTPFSFYCILSPVALSIRVFLREFSALVHEVAPREMLSVQGATEGG